MKKSYHPAFDIMMDALSSGNKKNKIKLEKYVAHRARFGVNSAALNYPECHHIEISDPQLRDIWNNVLQTIDTFCPVK